MNEAEPREDQQAAETIAGRVHDEGDDGQVVLSGRCGTCRYLLDSIGHAVSCAGAGGPR